MSRSLHGPGAPRSAVQGELALKARCRRHFPRVAGKAACDRMQVVFLHLVKCAFSPLLGEE